MQNENVVFVKCKLGRGGFPTERMFFIDSPRGGVYTGVAPARYCYTADKSPLDVEPARGQKVDGYLMGITLGNDEPVRVYLPDNNIYEIDSALLEEKGSVARVPVES
jgi:hypothetical protein